MEFAKKKQTILQVSSSKIPMEKGKSLSLIDFCLLQSPGDAAVRR